MALRAGLIGYNEGGWFVGDLVPVRHEKVWKERRKCLGDEKGREQHILVP